MAAPNDTTSVEYRDIPGWLGYHAGSDGLPYSSKCGSIKPLKTWQDDRGYLRVNLCRDGRTHCRLVHQVVLEAFVGPRPDDLEACHFPDPDRTNNRPDNLRWDTRHANAADSIKLGRIRRGSGSPMAKLTEADIPVIRELIASGVGHREVGRRYGVAHGTICRITRGEGWRHVQEEANP